VDTNRKIFMSTLLWYCNHCGAENEEKQANCFACQHPNTPQDPGSEEILLQGRYQLETRVGVGGFGCVYRAIDTQANNKYVALKQINLQGLNTQSIIEATEAFHREVALLTKLSNPHLPHIYEQFADQEHWYLVMDFIEGETLEHYLEDQRPTTNKKGQPLLPISTILDITQQLCSVLAYLHRQQPPIIFRDLKPSNIMRTPQGHIYLIDFGIARSFKPDQTHDTIPFGSPGYAAPEQYGKAQTTARSDIYSLGALLHHLLSGDDPADAPFIFAPLTFYAPGAVDSQGLQRLIDKMISLNAGQRPESILEVQTALQALVIVEPPHSIKHAGSSSYSPPFSQQGYPGQNQVQQLQQPTQLTAAKPSRRTLLKTGIGITLVLASGWALYEHTASNAAKVSRAQATAIPANKDFYMAALSTNGKFAALRTDYNQLALIDSTNSHNDTIATYTLPDNLTAMVWSSTIPETLALIYSDEATISTTIEVHTATKFAAQGLSTTLSRATISSAAWSPDGKSLALYPNYDANQFGRDVMILILSIPEMQTHTIYPAIALATNDNPVIAWSPTTPQLALGDDQGFIYLINTDTGETKPTYTGHQSIPLILKDATASNGITTIAWSPDGRSIASGDHNAQILIWDTQSFNSIWHKNGIANIVQIAWSPNGQMIAVVDDKVVLTVYRISDKKIIMQDAGDTGAGAELSWEKNNRIIHGIRDTWVSYSGESYETWSWDITSQNL
jgi:eukaryotic-like serine/threonine-protein kinase